MFDEIGHVKNLNGQRYLRGQETVGVTHNSDEVLEDVALRGKYQEDVT